MITKPGIYLDVAAADYHADPCPEPSFTQSIGKLILERSPLHAWHAHPRLNPDYRHDDATKFDVGNVAHKMLLGRGKEIVVLDFDDWRTKAAKEAREEAATAGKLAVLGKQAARADAMVRAAREQLEIFGLADFSGDSEVVIAWQQDGLWARSMIDRLSTSRTLVVDYKTSSMSCAPHGLGRMMETAGWHFQAAMHERGLDILDPDSAGRRRHLFAAQEDERPYCLTLVEIPESALTIGRKMLDMAFGIWRRSVEANVWPGYPQEIIKPEFPGWAETRWLEREVDHDERSHRAPRETVSADHFYGG